ncbi:arginine/serine-rich protein 1 [Salarias fasciatus]|uniref:arginine/serine-rich protein 1 n=1 Tax=Salarias fasciatus TaxID=181472 RepID=UPI001176BB51|nr:arginine/serine-rich protein 1 [Salarias fasciatus]
MMAKEARLHSDMAHARQSDGLNVIFDQKSPTSRCSRSRSRSSSSSSSRSTSRGSRRSSGSSVYRGRVRDRRRNRSSSSSRSSSRRSRSRSYPRCYRPSSRCRCDNHRRYGRGRHRRPSPPRYRARSRSYSRSPSYDRYSYRRNRSRSRSSSRWSRRHESQYRYRVSRRSRSRSRSSEPSVRLSVHDKKALLMAAKNNAEKILGVEKLALPESVKPILVEELTEATRLSPEPVVRVRPTPEKIASQSDEEEPDNMSTSSLSPKRKIISFSINNSVAKPTAAAPSCAKVTPRVDSYESRKPYGHWIPVRQGRNGRARKHAKSQ